MSERKLRIWQDAGLIDDTVADRIRAWEAENSRSVGVWAMIGLGALTVGLGLILVIAANWDAIPGEVRLAIHFLVMALLSLFILWRASDAEPASDFLHDGLLLIAATLGLTFFAHLGQVYQTSSPLWQPLLAWLILFTPLLTLFGRGWSIATVWTVGILGTAIAHANEYQDVWMLGSYRTPLSHPRLYWGLIACPPMLLAALAAVMRGAGIRPGYWRMVEQLAIATILTALSIMITARGWNRPADYIATSIVIQSAALAGAAIVTLLARRSRSGRATAGILGVAALAHLSEIVMMHASDRPAQSWVNAILFVLLWGAVAGAASHAGWRRMFQFAIGVIAMRIIMLSFQLEDDLLGNGVSLILSGIFAMTVAWGAVKISKRFAPERRGEA